MKGLLKIYVAIAALVVSTLVCSAQSGKQSNLFEMLDLNRKGLEATQKAYANGDTVTAQKELLKYYRNRQGVKLAGLNKSSVKNSKEEQQWADESLEHKFFAHKGYRPSYFYGDDINWRLWPVKDNELRWQLHRHYWFVPLAKAYIITGDKKYINAWQEQYADWVKKNPYINMAQSKKDGIKVSEEDAENVRFAWRPLETSTRLQDQLSSFELCIDSPEFTPEFLNLFLTAYHQHADVILNNYSKQGNHLLFEAQRMVYAGTYFPEFKDAEKWRKSGIDILNRELGVQVMADGMQFELDYAYHNAAIGIFLKALNMSKLNGMASEFPQSYIDTIEKMTEATYNLTFPDYSSTLFADCKQQSKGPLMRNFGEWSKIFPDNEQLKYFATDGKEGKKPAYNSHALKESGFFIFRNGWDNDATVMIVKAGPPAFWHNQPDNGTFELWRKGRNFFPDSGSYVYGGGDEVMKERNWFRQSQVHNTVTLGEKDFDTTDSKLIVWDAKDGIEALVTENQSYKDMAHQRAVLCIAGDAFVIVDLLKGAAEGDVNLNYHLLPSKTDFDAAKSTIETKFGDGNDITMQIFSPMPIVTTQYEGQVSEHYRIKKARPSIKSTAKKQADKEVLFTTVIAPKGTQYKEPKVSVKDGKITSVEVQIGAKKYKYDVK